jgi:hypothetical protein
MKLSEAQIDQLYAFTKQHFVVYYDLQTELVDHLANAIEAKWQQNPALSFEEILNTEFKKFGVFGFSDVVEKRQNTLNKKYQKLVWKHFLAFFKVPKILMIFSAFALIFYLLKHFPRAQEVFTIVFGVLTILLYFKIIASSIKRNKRPEKEKRWLFEEIIYGYGSVAAVLILPVQLLNTLYNRTAPIFDNDIAVFIGSFILICYFVVCYVILIVIPSKAKEYLAQTYPEYEMQQL